MNNYTIERFINDRDWAIRFTKDSHSEDGFDMSLVYFIELDENGGAPEFSDDWTQVEGSEIEAHLEHELYYDSDAFTYRDVIEALYDDSKITWFDRDPVKVEEAL